MKHTTLDPREEKLPKWAQNTLGVLRMRLQETREAVQEFADPIKGNRKVIVHPYSDNSVDLKGDTRVELAAGNMSYTVRLGRKGDGLQVYSTDPLHLEMVSSNVLWVRPAGDAWGDD